MFGKPEWFGEKNIGIGFAPATWRGWAYFLSWGSSVVMPAGVMGMLDKLPEAGIWTACSGGAFLWDALHLKKQTVKQRELDSLYYISDEPDRKITTSNYEMNIKR